MNCAGKSFLACFLLLTISVQADTIQDGKVAFSKGDFAEAIRSFESALAKAGPSAGLYYSLGIARQKSGERAQAAVDLRRAIMLDPRMVDARMALSEIERSQGVASIPAGWRERVAERVPLKALVITGCALAWLGAFALLFAIFLRSERFLPLAGALSLVAVGTGSFLVGYLADPRVSERNTAVVSEKAGVTLLSAPADQSATVIRLPGAASVQILKRSGDWTFCSAPGGERGWVPGKFLEPVVPTA